MKKTFLPILCSLALCACSSNAAPALEEDIEEENVQLTTEDYSEDKAKDKSEDLSDDQAEVQSEIQSKIEIPTEYHNEIDGVKFDIQVEAPSDIKAIVTATATLQEIDEQAAISKFLPLLDDYEEDADKSVYHGFYNVDAGEYLEIGTSEPSLSFNASDLVKFVSYTFDPDSSSNTYNGDQFQTGRDFSFASIQSAQDMVIDTLEEVGVSADFVSTCYSLDHETMRSYEKQMKSDDTELKSSWSESDDCYYFSMWQEYMGIPVYRPVNEYFLQMDCINAPVKAIVSADGIIEISDNGVVSFSNESTVSELASFDDIADSISRKYTQILSDSTYSFTNAKLVYSYNSLLEKKSYDVVPTWIITGLENGTSEFQIFINAVTGEEIVFE